MKILRSLLGRRQFLVAAFTTSTFGLAFKKFAGFFGPGFQGGVARASSVSGTDIKTAPYGTETTDKKMGSKRYKHLLSPLKIRNQILKNRIIHTVGIPHFLQGPETWPSEVYREYYARFARNGAAIVVVPAVVMPGREGRPVSRKGLYGDSAHMDMFDTTNPACENYLDQIIAAVHSYGSLVSVGMRGGVRADTVEEAVRQARALEDKGVDVIYMGGEFKDKERVKFAIERIQAVKSATNLLIALRLNVRGVDPRPEASDSNVLHEPSVEDTVSISKMYEGAVDILQFRLGGAIGSHPSTWQQDEGEPKSLIIARAIREGGSKMLLAPNGGFQDLGENEKFIASGQCDLITMIRPFHADFDYIQKAYEGRGEDVVPCIQCNKCHGLSMEGPWTSVCSVNPELGLEPAARIITPPAITKNVAVIGGGPAGMKAALTAAERGHRVALYEKESTLGGLLRHTDFSPYKWALRRYKDYLIRQVKKVGIEVHLNTEATPRMIEEKGYEAVLAAVGAEPVVPRIPGADGGNVYDVVEVYAKEKGLGKRVVVIGGGEFGVATGMFLANAGHETTVLTSDKELLTINRVHWEEIIIDVYEHLDNFGYIVEAIPTGISGSKVTYRDGNGREQSIQADDVVLYSGLRPKQDEALKFYGSGKDAFFTIGDCTGKCGNVQKATRNAYFTACQF